MTVGAIDYAASYFKCKTPTTMREEPTNKALKQLWRERQANASSIGTNLGGGNHEYLALVLTNQEYAQIPNTQLFIAPAHPPLLVVLIVTTAI